MGRVNSLYVPPSLSRANQAKCRRSYAEYGCQFLALHWRCANQAHDVIVYLGVWVICSLWSSCQAHPMSMPCILCGSNILQIARHIISLAPIFMIYLIAVWAYANESASNYAMHKYLSTYTFAIKDDDQISSRPYLRFKMSRFCLFVQSAYVPKVGSLIESVPSGDRTPFLNVILDFIHDKFLLNRNWLWLEPSGCLPHSFGSFSLSRGGEN